MDIAGFADKAYACRAGYLATPIRHRIPHTVVIGGILPVRVSPVSTTAHTVVLTRRLRDQVLLLAVSPDSHAALTTTLAAATAGIAPTPTRCAGDDACGQRRDLPFRRPSRDTKLCLSLPRASAGGECADSARGSTVGGARSPYPGSHES